MKNTKKQHHLFLIDGYGFVFRAYHSMPPMASPNGTPTNAVYGFTSMLLALKKQAQAEGASRMLVVFDAGSKTFRNDIYSEYKANRPPAPEDLIPQFPLVKDAAEAMNLPTLSIKGYEADDIIATYAKQASEAGDKVTIVSSDKDLMQLVDDDGNVEMYDAMKKKTIAEEQVIEKFGVTPKLVLDLLAMMGDSSDNIPGIPGIGPKTAAELINTYGDLEAVLANADKVKQNKRRENLIEFADQARLSYRLASLCFETPTDINFEDMELKDEEDDVLIDFLNKHGFKSLVARVNTGNLHAYAPREKAQATTALKSENTTTKNPIKSNYIVITNKKDLENYLANCLNSGILAQQWKHNKDGKLIGYSFCYDDGQACYVPVAHKKAVAQEDLFGTEIANNSYPQATENEVKQALAPYLQNPSILKIGHDIKPISNISPIDDIMVMSYILDSSQHKHDLTTLAEKFLNQDIALPEELTKSKTPLQDFDPKELFEPFCKQTDAIIRLYKIFKQRLFTEKMQTVYETLERPLVDVLSAMELEGIKVDSAILKGLSAEFSARINKLEIEIYQHAGKEFNIASPKQMGEVLFEDMGIEGGKKSKTGAYKTGVSVLEELSACGHVIADNILSWRGLSKLKSTYTDALQKQVNPKTGRVHTTFAMTSTSTGRLSSLNPNLQNIPIRSEDGQKIRTAFIAKKGYLLIGADYSQIELRLLADMANIETLRSAFKENIDIHAKTASQVFNVALDKVDSAMRRNAKAINFGIIYGQSAFGLANQLGISRTEAKNYIDAYFQQYPGIRQYMEETKEFARTNGFVNTLLGRKCFLNGINSNNGAERAFAERAAINAPLQGTAADIIKKAMIALHHSLKQQNLDAKIILQVHDELIVEAEKNCANKVMKLIKNEMEKVVTLSIPLTVDVKSGKHWGEIH